MVGTNSSICRLSITEEGTQDALEPVTSGEVGIIRTEFKPESREGTFLPLSHLLKRTLAGVSEPFRSEHYHLLGQSPSPSAPQPCPAGQSTRSRGRPLVKPKASVSSHTAASQLSSSFTVNILENSWTLRLASQHSPRTVSSAQILGSQET